MRRPEQGEVVVMVAPERENGRTWSIAGIVDNPRECKKCRSSGVYPGTCAMGGSCEPHGEDAIAEIVRKTRLRFPWREIAVVGWERRLIAEERAR